ncbi:sulfur carrier protein ThiS [Hoyosella subflava]|uniref:Putative thiamine biosynthesis protein ThiS n=1 Tax=Hoyosella subflava (strain DSM 45089 / JCM 17490 / NBRC 109087 / DQS3-9A1) TaxID=443218 RepID=F6EIR9_HOYSD|nr:sulfur carrier protein ThiS [Hoyosella subflava]AEF38993.1 Putative thiamine biosynthesis protein ThiS [Hoyosella subflava DQS3-9A1]
MSRQTNGAIREVQVNGEWREFTDGSSLTDLLSSLGLPEKGLAIAVNGDVVPKADWPQTLVHPASRIEIVTAVQGG